MNQVTNVPMGKIYTSTKNLEVNMLSFNRATIHSHVMSIAASISKHGWKGVVTLIYTNLFSKGWKYYVIDGQHRILACAIVGSQYRYEIAEVNSKEEVVTLMADLNNNSKSWFLEDYMNIWSASGIKATKAYSDLSEIRNITRLPLAPLIAIYGKKKVGSEGGKNTQVFKRGSFIFSNRTQGQLIVDEIVAIKNEAKFNIKDSFMYAFAEFIQEKKKVYNRNKFIGMIRKNSLTMKLPNNMADYRNVINKLYR